MLATPSLRQSERMNERQRMPTPKESEKEGRDRVSGDFGTTAMSTVALLVAATSAFVPSLSLHEVGLDEPTEACTKSRILHLIRHAEGHRE